MGAGVVNAPIASAAYRRHLPVFSSWPARPKAWMPVAVAMPLIHGGRPPKSK